MDVGYSRKEGTLSPEFDEQVLPQLASFSFDVGIINSTIGQSFATGQAAYLLSKYLGSDKEPDTGAANKIAVTDIEKNGKSMVKGNIVTAKRYFFGTDTTFGVKMTFGLETGGYPDSLNLGYKRKELAFVPIIESKDKTKVGLPSLISTVGAGVESGQFRTAGVKYKQFYATGLAASYLAAWPDVRSTLGTKILSDPELQEKLRQKQVFIASRKREESQRTVYDSIKENFNKLPDDQKKVASFDKAIELKLIDPALRSTADTEKIQKFTALIADIVAQNKEEYDEPLDQLNKFVKNPP